MHSHLAQAGGSSRTCKPLTAHRQQPSSSCRGLGRPTLATSAGRNSNSSSSSSSGRVGRRFVAAAAHPGGLDSATWSGEDFYSILGLHPTARPREIKAAYYSLVREHHPDRASNEGFDSTAFCALLNQIYQTLSDPDARAMYDAIAGFSVEAVNPFRDTSFPADQVFVDEVNCIGCGKCVRACPAAFFIEGSKYGRARVVPGADPLELQEEVQVAMETCPVDCIHWVTSPQLSMLETALERMERVDAFIMLRNHRSPGNVFEEAHRAWQKRQAAIATMRAQQAFTAAGGSSGSDGSGSSAGFATGWVSFWAQYVDTDPAESRGSSSGSNGGSNGGSSSEEEPVFDFRDPAARRLAELAGAATRAMRRWNMYRRLSKPLKALTDGRGGV